MYFVIVDIGPQLVTTSQVDSSSLCPNSSLFFTCNESIYFYNATWSLGGVVIVNESIVVENITFSLVTEDSYELLVYAFDIRGNTEALGFTYIADGTLPIGTVSLTKYLANF